MKWDYAERWCRRGQQFSVEVSRCSVDQSVKKDWDGVNRWAVYAYIYPDHPRFARFNGDRLFQEAAVELPLHCGPSLLRYHFNGFGCTSVQVGSDYNHLHDDEFSHHLTKDSAFVQFNDAERLFRFLDEEYEHAKSIRGKSQKTEG